MNKPRLSGGHPYRTATRFQRDASGKLLRDEEGYLVPIVPAKDEIKEKCTTPDERATARRRAEERRKVENKAMARERRRVNKRQKIGNPDCPPSRDEDFPLLAVLRRDGMDDAIRVVLEYRRLVAICAAEPLKGQSYSNSEATGLSIEYRSNKLDGVGEVNAAKKADYKNGVPGGEIEYRSEKKRSQGAYSIPARRKAVVEYDDNCEPSVGRTESLHVKVTEDMLHERIDKMPLLMRIRSALGPLVDPFEDAVLGGQTMRSIGERSGYVGRTAEISGKALVMQAISTADRFLGVKKYAAANDNYLIERRKLA